MDRNKIYEIELVSIDGSQVSITVTCMVGLGAGGSWIKFESYEIVIDAIEIIEQCPDGVVQAMIWPNTFPGPEKFLAIFVPNTSRAWVRVPLAQPVSLGEFLQPGCQFKLKTAGVPAGPLCATHIQMGDWFFPILKDQRLLGALPSNLWRQFAERTAIASCLDDGTYSFSFMMKLDGGGDTALVSRQHDGEGKTLQEAVRRAIWGS
ncbi:hypothetical protein HN699_00115 [Candidatus Uhrbacteria bacterium]|nr:hypothetical protein [Candidatus Uhrbacteria bacterium]